MRKPKILLITLCSAMAINANAISFSNWFGGVGDDGKAGTSGNAAAQQSKTAKSQTGKLKFNLVNRTNTVLTSAVLKDKTGKVLFTTTKGKSCAVNSVCTINIDQKLIANDRTFFFYDSNNKLASAYSFTNLGKNSTSIDAQADLASLGRYVFVKIQTSAPKITFTNLATSFYDVKDEKDPFTALGDYYLDFLGNSTNDSAVIKELVKQVSSNKPLLINPQSTRVVNQDKPMVKGTNFAQKGVQSGKSAQAEEETGANPLCSAGFKSSMDFVTSALNSLVPIPGLALFTKGAGTVADIACPSGSTDYSASFTEINAKLDALAKDLALAYAEIKEFRDEWRNAEIGTYITNNLTNNTNAIDTIIRSYYIDLLKTPGKDGKVHDSLESLAASYGGVEQAMKNKAFKEKVDKFVENSATIVTDYKNMVNNSDKAKSFLDLRCGNYSTMPKEIIATRLECNYSVLEIYTKLRVTADVVESSFADYKKTFGAEASGGFATLDDATITSTNAAIDKFIPKTALYDPLAGLDKNLIANIKATSACNIRDKEMSKDITQITAWYGPNSPAGTSPYITTTCFGNIEDGRVGDKITSDFKDQITSNYHYINPNTKTVDAEVINVLGVLVPKRFFTDHNSDAFAHTDWERQSVEVENPKDGDTISRKYFVNQTTAINNNSSGYPTTVVLRANSIFPNTNGIHIKRDGKDYERKLFTPLFPSSVAGALELQTMFYLADYWGNSSSTTGYSNNLYTYMRTLDENNVGRVWVIKNDMNRDYVPQYAKFYFSFRMQLLCMTNDCKSDTGSLIYDKGLSAADTKISFTNGKNGSQFLDSKLEVNGKTGF